MDKHILLFGVWQAIPLFLPPLLESRLVFEQKLDTQKNHIMISKIKLIISVPICCCSFLCIVSKSVKYVVDKVDACGKLSIHVRHFKNGTTASAHLVPHSYSYCALALGNLEKIQAHLVINRVKWS